MKGDKRKFYWGFVFWIHTPWEFLSDEQFSRLLKKPWGELDDCLEIERKVKAWRQGLDDDIQVMRHMGVSHLRTNISWAEYCTPNGTDLLEYYLPRLAEYFNVMPCLNYTPPYIAEVPRTNAPPKNLLAFSYFKEKLLQKFGSHFTLVQEWNEPNLNTDWDSELDPRGEKFVTMIKPAAKAGKLAGKTVVIGGMNKPDLDWFRQFCRLGGMQDIDVIALNGLRATWSERVPPVSWVERLAALRQVAQTETGKYFDFMISEAGYPTVDYRVNGFTQEFLEQIQCSVFVHELSEAESIDVPFYWYTLRDMNPEIKSVRAVTTGWEDSIQYYFGCLTYDRRLKLLGKLLQEGGLSNVRTEVIKNGWGDLWKIVIDRGSPI